MAVDAKITLDISVDATRAVEAFDRLARLMRDAIRAGVQHSAEKRAELERRIGTRRLELAEEAAAADPNLHVQVITTSEGRCRVSVKRLGGWS